MFCSSYLRFYGLAPSQRAAVSASNEFRNSPIDNVKLGAAPNKSICGSSTSSLLHKSPPLAAAAAAASVAILLWSHPGFSPLLANRFLFSQQFWIEWLKFSTNRVSAGILSGFSGLESIPGPQLPEIDFLKQLNEENQKKYAELDSKFKSSPMIKELLERSKQNKEKYKQQLADKYCLRGAEWGVGDCSTEGMTAEEKENFISMLKQKTGTE
ncbi:hypothetical protein ACLOJK_038430 [Asimina triloba]